MSFQKLRKLKISLEKKVMSTELLYNIVSTISTWMGENLLYDEEEQDSEDSDWGYIYISETYKSYETEKPEKKINIWEVKEKMLWE